MANHDRLDDASSAIHQSKKPQKLKGKRTPARYYSGAEIPEKNNICVGIGIDGNVTQQEEDMIAKGVTIQEKSYFYIKFSTSGPDIGHMINPVGIYFNPDELKRDDSKRGKGRYEFKKVPCSSYESYVIFLRTKNETFLRIAERQVLDG